MRARLGRKRRRDDPAPAAIDLDGLNTTGDRLGHKPGDALLRPSSDDRPAGVLSSRPHGGDEVVLLLPDLPRVAVEERIEALVRDAQAGEAEPSETPSSFSTPSPGGGPARAGTTSSRGPTTK